MGNVTVLFPFPSYIRPSLLLYGNSNLFLAVLPTDGHFYFLRILTHSLPHTYSSSLPIFIEESIWFECYYTSVRIRG